MSLIDDALKRARERTKAAEAPPARKDPWAYAPLPERSGPRARTILAVALLVALAAAVGILVVGRRSGGGPPASAPSATLAPTPGAAPEPQTSVASRATTMNTVEVAPPQGVRSPQRPGTAVSRPTESLAPPATGAIAPPTMPIGVSRVPESVPAAALPTPRPAPAAAASSPPPAPNRPPSPPGQSRPPSDAVRQARFASAAPLDSPPVVEMTMASGSPRIVRAPSTTSTFGSTSVPAPAPGPVPAASTVAVPDAGSRPRSDYDAPPVAAGPRSALPSVAPRGDVVRSSASNIPAKNYVSSFTAPNGAKIDLGGIVYSETSPVALVNGRVLPPGGMVEGLMVVSIEENRLELEGEGVHVFLSLK